MFLPLFPLELVVFPGEKLKLHIFEPRYIQMINECHDGSTTFGIPAYLDGKLATHGTEMRLLSIEERYETGEMDIITQGAGVFHLDEFIRNVPDKLYYGGNVTLIENDGAYYQVTFEELVSQYARLHKILKTGLETVTLPRENPSFTIGQEVGLDHKLKLHLLATPKEADRQIIMIDYLHKVIPEIEKADAERKVVRSNGHFKKLPSAEL